MEQNVAPAITYSWLAASGLMDDGEMVARVSWPKDWFAYKTFVVVLNRWDLRLTRPGDEASTWEPTDEDKAATDWVIYPF